MITSKKEKRYFTTTMNFKNKELYSKFKALCYLQNRNIIDVLEELMQEYINKHYKKIF